MTQQRSSDNTLRLLLDKLNKLEEGIKNLQITNKTLTKENANRVGEIKELAHKLNIQTYSAFLMISAPTMKSQRATSDYRKRQKGRGSIRGARHLRNSTRCLKYQ